MITAYAAWDMAMHGISGWGWMLLGSMIMRMFYDTANAQPRAKKEEKQALSTSPWRGM